MTRRTRRDIGRAVTSLVAFVGLLVLVPIGLVAATHARFGSPNPMSGVDPPWRWLDGGGGSLSESISDDTFLDGLIRASLCVVWAALTVILITTIVEVVHQLRHRGMATPQVRGLGWAQGVARFVAVGLLVVLPAMRTASSDAASLPGGVDHRSAAPAARTVVEVAPTPIDPPTPAGAPSVDTGPMAESPAAPAATAHTVRPGESVYSIAERLAAGSSRSTIEVADAILDANLGTTMGPGERFTNPAYIQVGWVLQIPAGLDAPEGEASSVGATDPSVAAATPSDTSSNTSSDTYVVQSGDTLWDIADEQLGDATRWPEVWDRNAGADMGAGRTFDDPNLILPGWELELTGDASSDASAAEAWPPPGPLEPATSVAEPATPVAEPTPSVAEPVTPVAEPTTSVAELAVEPDGDAADAAAPVELAQAESTTPAESPAPLFDMSDPIPRSPATPAGPSLTTTSTSTSAAASDSTAVTSTTMPAAGATGDGSDDPVGRTRPSAPSAPTPIRVEHAALLAGGILALVGVRRRQRLRAARPRHRVPEPRPDVVDTERRLRIVDAGERALRVDVASRAAAWALTDADVQIGWIEVSTDGDVDVRLTGPAHLPPPWTGADTTWRLGAEVPIELLSEEARQVGMPCVAFVQVGRTAAGGELLTDVEACGTLAVEATAAQADEVVASIAAGLASSLYAEVAHLIAVSLPEAALLGHRNAHLVESADAALELATSLVGTTVASERSTFALRSLRTGGEMWEPAIVMLTAGDDATQLVTDRPLPPPGHGIGVVVASAPDAIEGPVARIVAESDGWRFTAFGASVDFTPVGLSPSDLAAVDDVLADAGRELESMELSAAGNLRWNDVALPTPSGDALSPIEVSVTGHAGTESAASEVSEAPTFEPMAHEIIVGLLGPVEIVDREGNPGRFERSKTVELIAWLTTHRERATRTGARTALWEMDVRDATFANVVSEARRALARLVPPPVGEEWVARTLTEQLPVHDAVVTDAQLVEERLAAARLQPPAQAMEVLRPAVASIRDMPFAGTSYLWPDAEGITSNLVLVAITAATEYAAHALSLGDIDGVFWATGQGLKVLAGHEELIGLRMQAHARAGDLAGVRQEWESYERILVADAWSDGEPAPKLVALRRELLAP